MTTRLTVIMTVHNRREITMRCLRAFFGQHTLDDVECRVVVVDDGSTDGTGEAIADEFPNVTIINGSGSLFWAAGMAAAETVAMSESPDLLLWLNDDVVLDPDALDRLIAVHRHAPWAIIIGSTRDPDTGQRTYGPRRRLDRHPQRFALIDNGELLTAADAFNGNVVLIPLSVWRRVGPIDGEFAHAYADDDYSIRARDAGVPLLACPGTQGTCPANPARDSVHASSLRGAWKVLQQPTRRPWASQVRFLRRHAGWRWPVYLAAGYTKAMVTTRYGTSP